MKYHKILNNINMMTLNDFTTEQLQIIVNTPRWVVEKELERRNPVNLDYLSTLKVGDCFLKRNLTEISHIYRVKSIGEDSICFDEIEIDFESNEVQLCDYDVTFKGFVEIACLEKIDTKVYDTIETLSNELDNKISSLFVELVEKCRTLITTK